MIIILEYSSLTTSDLYMATSFTTPPVNYSEIMKFSCRTLAITFSKNNVLNKIEKCLRSTYM
jgi:hypothetical protein